MNRSAEGRAASAVARLHEIIQSMGALWHRSVAEGAAEAPVDLYVADANVIMMFMSPGEKHSYGAMLRYDQVARRELDRKLIELETRTAAFLADLLFFELKPTVPVGILPHHALELERMLDEIGARLIRTLVDWDAILAAVEQSSSRAYETSRARFEEAATTLSTAQGNEGSIANEDSIANVKRLLRGIADSLRGDGGLGMLFRFDTLIKNDRLRHLDRLALLDEAGATTYLPSPFDAQGEAAGGVAMLQRRLERTMSELQKRRPRRQVADGGKAAPPRRRPRAIRNDAAALTQLAWLNDRLGESAYFVDHGGRRRRVGGLVLVSGSLLMARAVAELELTALERVMFAPLALLGHQSLDEYVRGSTPEAGTSGAVLESSLMINFLDTMQRSLHRGTACSVQQDIELALAHARSDHQRLIDSWQQRQLVSRPASSDPVSEALLALEEAGTSLDKLRGLVSDLSVKAWQKFASSIAFLSYSNATTGGSKRNIPPVRFAGYPQADGQAEQLRAYAGKDDTQVDDRPLDVAALTEEDPSRYTEFMCFGLWNLRHRALSTAQGCIEQALTIAEESGPARSAELCEALFVQAHLVRLNARALEDMDRARQSMHRIDTIMSGLPELATGGQPGAAVRCWHGAGDIRFAAEDFSIVCHRLYFEVLGPNGAAYDGGALVSMFERGLALLGRLPAHDASAGLDYVTEYCRQQLLGNLVHLALLVKFGHTLTDRGDFQSFVPLDPRVELPIVEGPIAALVQGLIEVCEYLRRQDKPAALPKASLLSESLACVGADVWLGKQDLAGWFSSVDAHWTHIDQQRIRYLDGVRQRQRH